MIRRNDEVIVITGKDKGTRGKVLSVLVKRERAVIEKVNLIKRHTKPTQKMPKGGIVEKEASIHLSNLMLFCGKCGKGVRAGAQIAKDGKKQRICKKCGVTLGQ